MKVAFFVTQAVKHRFGRSLPWTVELWWPVNAFSFSIGHRRSRIYILRKQKIRGIIQSLALFPQVYLTASDILAV